MKWIRIILQALLLVAMSAGCTATLGKIGTGTARTIKPEYARAIEQIEKLIAGDAADPIEGYEPQVIWKYRGQVIDPADLERALMWVRTEKPKGFGFEIVGKDGSLSPADQRLRDQINDILRDSGIEVPND